MGTSPWEKYGEEERLWKCELETVELAACVGVRIGMAVGGVGGMLGMKSECCAVGGWLGLAC